MSKFVQKILNESVLRDVIEHIPDLGREIGEGVNGIAFDYDNKVMKVTNVMDDANIALLAKDKKLKHFSTVYTVEEFILNGKQTGVYGIVREKLDELKGDEYSIIQSLADQVEGGYYADIDEINEEELFQIYDSVYVQKLANEYRRLLSELVKFKMFDLNAKNLGRNQGGILAAFDAETTISFPSNYKPISKLYLNSFGEDISEAIILKELDNSNAAALPDTMPNEFSEYMSEATAESMTMETGAIPNSLDESKKIIKVLKQLEEAINSLSQKDITIITNYVNYHKKSSSLIKINIPNELKYTGPVYRLFRCKKSDLNTLLQGGDIIYDQTYFSYAKSMNGIMNFYYDLVSNSTGGEMFGFIVKANLKLTDCIIDIPKFAELYPNAIHKGHTNYLDEDEVIGKNILHKINLSMIDKLIVDSEICVIKEAKEKLSPLSDHQKIYNSLERMKEKLVIYKRYKMVNEYNKLKKRYDLLQRKYDNR